MSFVESLIREATRLTPLPQSALRLVTILVREDWEPEEVTEIVRTDPVLTGRVLSFANSAVSGSHSLVSTVDEAVHRIGARGVAAVAVSIGAKRQMFGALPQLGLVEGELWRHSVAALIAAELAAALLGIPESGAATTAALLHDVGKVVMARLLDPDTLDHLRAAQMAGGAAGRAAEIELLSVSHAQLSASIADHWGLPDAIGCAIRWHDDLGGAPAAHRRNAALVQLADSAAKEVVPPTLTSAADDSAERAAALAVLGVRASRLTAFLEALEERVGRLADVY